jgi:hypothetical protein
MTTDQLLAALGALATLLVGCAAGGFYVVHQASAAQERRARLALKFAKLLDNPNTGPQTKSVAEAGLKAIYRAPVAKSTDQHSAPAPSHIVRVFSFQWFISQLVSSIFILFSVVLLGAILSLITPTMASFARHDIERISPPANNERSR